MAYSKIKSYRMTEPELRKLWKDAYCDPLTEIYTHDKVRVMFYESMFDHVFYESDNRKARDKSILSLNRLEKMMWIRDTLEDPTAVLKQGWDRDSKSYDNGRRVALIKNNYVVVIRFTGLLKASFVTAYELTDETGSSSKILNSPDWVADEKYLGKA
jgi:hypothetical protein